AIGEYPRVDVAASLQRLDAFAREVRDLVDGVAPGALNAGGMPSTSASRSEQSHSPPQAPQSPSPHGPTTLAARQIAALNAVLFAGHGFAGDTEDYYNPENSFLHRVIERRRGIPITLAVVYLEVARRAG